MVVLQLEEDRLFIHPALNPQEVNAQFFPNFETSMEFAIDFWKWGRGDVGTSPRHLKAWNIARRKSAYGAILINDTSILTPAGEVVLNDIQQLVSLMQTYFRQFERTLPKVFTEEGLAEITRIEDMLPLGRVTPADVMYLRIMYNMNHELPGDLKEGQLAKGPNPYGESEIYEGIGKNFMRTNPLRKHPLARNAVEHLLKYGFAELQQLPKPVGVGSRGRPPLGVSLTIQGQRFFELFVDAFDPAVQRMREWGDPPA